MSGISRAPAHAIGVVDRTVAQSLHHLRLKSGLTQAEMARLLGVAKSDLIDYETARARAPAAFLLKVCQALSVSPETFYGGFTARPPQARQDEVRLVEPPRSWAR